MTWGSNPEPDPKDYYPGMIFFVAALILILIIWAHHT
jgi:hypothetical protein